MYTLIRPITSSVRLRMARMVRVRGAIVLVVVVEVDFEVPQVSRPTLLICWIVSLSSVVVSMAMAAVL